MQAGKAARQAGLPGTSTGWEPVGQMRAGPHAALHSPHQPLRISEGLAPPEMDPEARVEPESLSWPMGRFGSRHRCCL